MLICTQDADCGFGTCQGNGSACQCIAGYSHDSLITLYGTCFMPSWVPYAFAVSFIVLAALLFAITMYQWRATLATPTQVILASTLFATMSCILYGIGSIALSTVPNALSWSLYFLLMALHICVLIPLVARHIIPPAFHMIFMYPRWFDMTILLFIVVSCVGLVYTWIFSMIALSYGNIAMFNDGVTIWFAVCGVLTIMMTSSITIAVNQLVRSIDSLTPKPFYRDLDVLRSRTRKFQVTTCILGSVCCILLFVIVILHFTSHGHFRYRFVLTWILFLLLIITDAVVVWFSHLGSSISVLSTPKSNLVIDDNGLEMGTSRNRNARAISFSGSPDIGSGDGRVRTPSMLGARFRGNSKDSADGRFVEVAVV